MSLANKYRPDTFDTTVWQEHITEILKSKIKNSQQNNHNYLFFWPRWTWKTSVARILSKAMNCLDLQDGNPCNKCANCVAINEWKTLDYVEIDAASHTWVDNIRDEIIAKTDYPPTQLKKKIYVIDEVHMLSKWAFNALLKTIEEPKDYMSFILATTEIDKVPETIVSRCQVFNFKKIPQEKMVSRLQTICKDENLEFENEALELIAKISEWCARDAVKYVDQVSIFGNISTKNVTNFLWIAGDLLIKDFLDIIKSWDRTKLFEKIDEINNCWIDLTQFAKQVLWYIDSNLDQDMDLYLRVSEIMWNILSVIRYYPYPTIVYKMSLNKLFQWDESPQPIIMPKQIKKVEEPQKTTIETPISKEDPKDIKSEKIEKYNWEIDDSILVKIASMINWKTLQNWLQNFVHIKNVSDWKIELIVIDKITEIAMKKEDNKKELEQKFLELTWTSYAIDINFMDKNEYFASQF